MLLAHFHDVTYDHIWLKNTAGAHKEPSKIYKSNLRTLKSKLRAMPNQTRVLHEHYKIKHLLHFDDLLTAEIPDYADLIKVLNISKTTQAFTSSTEM